MTSITPDPGALALAASIGRHRQTPGLHTSPAAIISRMAAMLAVLAVAFALFQSFARQLEASAVAALLRLLAPGGIGDQQGSLILIMPRRDTPFWVELTPSCSSLAPVLALVFVTYLLSAGRGGRRRWLAVLVAAVTIVLGNLLRIGASAWAGILYGRISLVLFHDWVGSVFGFAYTLLGFVLMLSVLLPSAADARVLRPGNHDPA